MGCYLKVLNVPRSRFSQRCGRRLPSAIFAGLLFFVATHVFGGTLYWDTNGATTGAGATPTGVWDIGSTANWSTNSGGTVATTTWSNNSDAVFSAGSDGINSFNVNIASGQSISANSILVEEGNPTIQNPNNSTGSSLSLGSGGITVNSGAGLTIALNNKLNLSLSASQTWTNNSSNSLSVTTANAPTFDLGGNTLTVAGTGNTTITNAISGTGGAITKNGTGILTFNGNTANTYTGLTTVNTGELDLAKTAAVNAIAGGGLTINGGTVKYTNTSTNMIADTANVTIAGGTLDLNNHADTIGSLTFNSGTLTSTGGTQTLTLAGSTATTLQMQGGATIPSSVNIAFSSATTTGVGMTFDASNNGTATINGNINLNTTATAGFTRTFTINDGAAASDTTIGGIISDTTSTALTKTGAGTLTLTGANTYRGGTTVNAGTLFVNNSTGSGTGTGAVTVNGSGTLGGSGTITGAVTVGAGGTINGGGTAGAVGTLNVNNGALTALTLNSTTSTLGADMTATTADQINVTGMVNLGSNVAQLVLNIPNGTVFAAGQQFVLINNDLVDAISGTFANAPAGTDTIDGYSWIVSYTSANGLGNDFVLTAVPEPSTWLAAALALGAIGFSQRKRVRAWASSAVERDS